MTEELEQILSKLEIRELKELAEVYEIDCQGCEEKEEYIIQISDSQKVTAEDVQSLFGITKETASTPSEDSMPSFNDAEKLMQDTKNIYDSGDYIATIGKATEAIDCGSKALNAFYSKGLSYAILSTENMIYNLKDMEIDVSPIEEILGNAKASYDNQELESTGAIISQLRDSVGELLSAHGQKISDIIQSTQFLIDSTREMGANVVEAEKKLNEAKELHAQGSFPSAFDSVKESESLAQGARDKRIMDIREILSRSVQVIEDAKYLHAPIEEAESLLEAAQTAFDSEDYILAIENAGKASESANFARDEQIQRALRLQEKIKGGEVAVPASAAESSRVIEDQEAVSSEVEEEVKAEEKQIPKEEGLACPKCEGEPTYVEQYDRYYCYTCGEYIEPVAKEEKKEEIKEEPAKEEANLCPKCEGEASYVEQYDRYYCYTCSEYIEPVAKKEEEKVKEEAIAAKVCPKCGGEPSYVEQYDRYYCYTCSEYVEPVEKTEGEKPKEEEEPEEEVKPEEKEAEPQEAVGVCPKCEGEPTYFEQYDRYYCYTCNEYIEPKEKEEKREEEEEKPKAAKKVCPKCEGEPTFVEQYQRYYCYTCNAYVDPKEKVPEKEPGENACPTCGQDATYVDQYQRYYCYTCNKYL